MIKFEEIQLKAKAESIRDKQIEKDYVLSWILSGISKQKHLSEIMAFKGGTALKKIYFEDYRFSEDLDFTLINFDISNEQIRVHLKESLKYIKNETNIQLEIINSNEHQDGGLNFFISYIGPLGGQGNNKKIKIDIAKSEQLIFEPEMKDVIISYSDLAEHKLLCYPLEEIILEKMRSIMQRMQPRDLYDIWYLLSEHQMDIHLYMNEFEIKCKNKGLNHTDFSKKFTEHLPEYKNRWYSSMHGQIKEMPDFEKVEREVKRHLKQMTQKRKLL